jgi:cell cycle checkpoint protein
VRGTQHALPSPVARRGQRLLKPPFFAALAAERAAGDALGAVQDWLHADVRAPVRVAGQAG